MKLREVVGRGLLAACAFGVCALVRAQNETTASLSGELVASTGVPVDNAEVRLTHRSTGGEVRALSNESGRFTFQGLRVDGAYVLNVTAYEHAPQMIKNLEFALGEQRSVRVVLAKSGAAAKGAAEAPAPAVLLEKIVVTAARTEPRSGAGTTLARDELEDMPSVERSLNEYARADPRVTLIDAERGELAAAGQNSRFNSVQIDGVRLDDQFGLTANGVPSQGNPFSMETLEAIAVDLSPYDAGRSGFTGASINAITRSGTNEFHGSLYATYRNQNYRGKNPTGGGREPFADWTGSVTLGGPVVRNRLFFFAAYERSERTEPAPAAGFAPSAESLARIFSAARIYAHDPGSLENPGQQRKQDNKYLAKLDWRVSARQRLSLRYSETRGHQPVFVDYSTPDRVSLSGHWYESEQTLTAWSAQLFSRWHDGFQSEVKVARNRYEAGRAPRSRFPQVRINGVPDAAGETGSVFLGADDTSQVNDLGAENTQVNASATWLAGAHRVSAGFDVEHSEFENTFLQNGWGSYSFSNIDNFAAGKPSAFTYQYLLPGKSPTVAWGYLINSFFLQDTWQPTPRFSLTAGLRFDRPIVNRRPEYNALVEKTFGRRNDATVDGASTLAPRVSFSYKPDEKRRMHLRGGAGIFQGKAPGVWMSNAYSNDGKSALVNTSISSFSSDPLNQPKGNPATQRQRVDLMDAGFHLPTVLRANLAFDYRLPWQDVTVSTEILQTWTMQALAYRNLNLRRTGTGPDGRAIYGDRTGSLGLSSNSQFINAGFTDVYLLTNTSKGDATQFTVRARRPLRGHWAASVAYTRGRSREVSPATSSTAGTNFSTRAGLDPNDDELGTSNYEVRDRVLASVTARFAVIRKFDTKVTLLYEGRSGRPYSFIFGNDVNGDSADQLNDLLYVPAGRGDPRVRWADAAQADAFFAYLDGNAALRRFAGKVVPRNSERSDFLHQVDLKFSQMLPLWRGLRGEVFCDILNVANLVDRRWGRFHQVNFPYGLIVANASYDPATNQYAYRYTGARTQTLQGAASRWQIQTGARVKF